MPRRNSRAQLQHVLPSRADRAIQLTTTQGLQIKDVHRRHQDRRTNATCPGCNRLATRDNQTCLRAKEQASRRVLSSSANKQTSTHRQSRISLVHNAHKNRQVPQVQSSSRSILQRHRSDRPGIRRTQFQAHTRLGKPHRNPRQVSRCGPPYRLVESPVAGSPSDDHPNGSQPAHPEQTRPPPASPKCRPPSRRYGGKYSSCIVPFFCPS